MASLATFVGFKKQPLTGEMSIWKGYKILNNIYQGYILANSEKYEIE